MMKEEKAMKLCKSGGGAVFLSKDFCPGKNIVIVCIARPKENKTFTQKWKWATKIKMKIRFPNAYQQLSTVGEKFENIINTFV